MPSCAAISSLSEFSAALVLSLSSSIFFSIPSYVGLLSSAFFSDATDGASAVWPEIELIPTKKKIVTASPAAI